MEIGMPYFQQILKRVHAQTWMAHKCTCFNFDNQDFYLIFVLIILTFWAEHDFES
jgi:hypothetical protein